MADYYDRGYPGGGGGGGYPGGEPSYMSELLPTDEELGGGIFYQRDCYYLFNHTSHF